MNVVNVDSFQAVSTLLVFLQYAPMCALEGLWVLKASTTEVIWIKSYDELQCECINVPAVMWRGNVERGPDELFNVAQWCMKGKQYHLAFKKSLWIELKLLSRTGSFYVSKWKHIRRSTPGEHEKTFEKLHMRGRTIDSLAFRRILYTQWEIHSVCLIILCMHKVTFLNKFPAFQLSSQIRRKFIVSTNNVGERCAQQMTSTVG